jgi:hypothetical protein
MRAFFALVQLGDQQALVVLGFSPLGHIDIDARHALGTAGTVIVNKASRLNPPDFVAGTDEAR